MLSGAVTVAACPGGMAERAVCRALSKNSCLSADKRPVPSASSASSAKDAAENAEGATASRRPAGAVRPEAKAAALPGGDGMAGASAV